MAVTCCDIHEFPELPQEASFTLHLNFDTEMPLHKEAHQAVRSIGAMNDYDIRHMVSVHRLNTDGSYGRQADTLIVFTRDDVENLDCSRQITLRAGYYNLFVWTDYVDKGSTADKFYSTVDFSEIILRDKSAHMGNCDFRDTFRGMQQATVTVKTNEQMVVNNEATVTMRRPLAKFKFISTDYELFKNELMKAEREKAAKKKDNAERSAESITLEDYRIVFRYTGFMPCSYNMFTDRPADAWTGTFFGGASAPTDDGELELGFDYVFVNGSESSVSVMVEIYHKDGGLIASSPSIDVPLARSKLTIVKGNFLTSAASGSVGVDPSFNGEWNIEIK